MVLRRYPRRMVEALAESNVALARRLRDLTVGQPAHGARAAGAAGPQDRLGADRHASCWRWWSGCRGRIAARVLDLPMGRTDMADHLGLTIETVCRVLAHLRRDGTIAIERGSVTIRDMRRPAADGVGTAALIVDGAPQVFRATAGGTRNGTISRFHPLIATTAMVRSTSSCSENSARVAS